MKKTKISLKKARMGIFFGIIASLLSVFVCVIFLGHHLLEIQIPERLRYIKDYTDFTLTVEEMPNCTNQITHLFQYKNEVYNGLCVKQVYVNYGRVKAPLEMVLNEEYINLNNIKKKLSSIDSESKQEFHYEYRRSETPEGNYRVTITNKDYQNSSVVEVMFEPFWEKDELDASVKIDGSLDIN